MRIIFFGTTKADFISADGKHTLMEKVKSMGRESNLCQTSINTRDTLKTANVQDMAQ